MKQLLKYAANSQLMEISIIHNGEKFGFNLFKEIEINDVKITRELRDQPSSYSFLTVLHKSLIKKLGEAKIKEKKAYASAYIKAKRQINPETSRPNSDDLAKQKAELAPDYLLAQQKVIDIQYNTNRIEAAVKAFEQRASILQTLSANRRAERD